MPLRLNMRQATRQVTGAYFYGNVLGEKWSGAFAGHIQNKGPNGLLQAHKIEILHHPNNPFTPIRRMKSFAQGVPPDHPNPDLRPTID